MLDVTYDADSDSTKGSQNGDDAQGNTPDTPKNNQPSGVKQNIYADLSPSDEDEASEVESFSIEPDFEYTPQLLLSSESVAPETQERFEALLEAAGLGKTGADGKVYNDSEVIQRLTTSVDSALHEAETKLARMRAEQQAEGSQQDSARSLANACSKGDIGTVRQLLGEGRSVHETTEEGESLLSLACSAGYYELAQVLLAMRANVEDRGIKGDCTPLMEAASGGYVDIVRLLIAHDADVNAQSSAGNTPLHYAACGGHEEVVRVLIEANANVEEHNENGHTPLMEAASAGHVGVAGILLYFGAGINTHSNEFKESALTLACYKGHLEMVKFLLEAGADHEHKTDEMHTALMEACMDGHVDVARLLLESGAQVNMPVDSFESPLTLAACGGHVELANLLIEQGADLEEVNDEGYTPLMEAAREGHEDMVALLLEHGANINGQTEETQETALTLACCGGFQEVGDFLIKAGADLELGCSTPLMEAAQEGHLELVKYLIQVGANVHAQTQTGDTALTYACENGHTDVAEVLLEAGAQLEHESEGGRTPLMKAARAGHLCTVQFLISKGADVNRGTSTSDHTVLSLACAGGHLNVVELLLRHSADSTKKLKDGSTMLIEAAKGGHTQVVNMLLDWPSNVLSPSQSELSAHLNSPSTQGAVSSSDQLDVPRVPTHGLANIVPRQDPNQVAAASAQQLLHPAAVGTNVGTIQAGGAAVTASAPSLVPGEVDLSNLTVPHHEVDKLPTQAMDLLKENLRWVMSKTSCQAGNTPAVGADGKGGGGEPGATASGEKAANGTTNNAVSGEEGDKQTESEKSLPEGGSPIPLDFDDQDMKASDRLEAFINKMMQKAELLNTTREEQILKKQQILEELQKVGNLLLDSVLKSRQQGQTASGEDGKQAKVSGDGKTSDSNPFAGPDSGLTAPSHPGVLPDELEAYLACFGEMNPEEDAEPSALPGPENLEGMVEELRVKLEKSTNILGEPETTTPPTVEDLEEVGREGALTCAPDPVPLHIALKNDLQAQVELQQRLAQQLLNPSVTRVANNDKNSRRRKEPIGEEGNSSQTKGNSANSKQAKLAKQESVSSVASSSDLSNASSEPRSNSSSTAATTTNSQGDPGLLPTQARDSMVPPDGTSVDPLPYFTPPTGSPVRDNTEESNPSSSLSTSDHSSRASSEDVDLTPVVPVSDGFLSVTSRLGTEVVTQTSASAVDMTSGIPDLAQHAGVSVSGQVCSNETHQLGNLMTVPNPSLIERLQGAGESNEMLPYILPPVADARLNNMVANHQQQQQFTPHQMQLLQEQLLHHQILRHRLKVAKENKVKLANSMTQTRHLPPGSVALSHNIQHLHNLMIPLQLDTFTGQPITPANAAAIQQQLEQQRQQLQDQLALQQKLQIELQQQLKLQQEHEQLKQQLKQHQQQVALQQKQLQVGEAQTNKVKGNQVKIQQHSETILSTTTTMENLQQEINKQELQQFQLQQVQQHLQQLHQQLQQVQQLQNNHQLTQQELLQQAQQLQQQLQVAQMQQFAVQPLQPQVAVSGVVSSAAAVTQSGGQPVQVNQMTQLLTQQDLLQHAQQLQHLAQLQRQQNQLSGGRNHLSQTLTTSLTTLPGQTLLNNSNQAITNVQKKAKKKLFNVQEHQLLPQQQQQQQQLQQQQFHHLQLLQQQQLQQQLQQQQHLYQLQQQQQAQYQHTQMLQNPQLVQQLANYHATVASNANNIPNSQLYDYYMDLISPSTPATPNPSPASPQIASPVYPAVELDAQTDSNHDTALTLACAGGHTELVSLLLSRGADIEHRDKKGFTPLILASTAGHADGCEILLDHGADLEAQSDRTKDTALSLACSGGRYEVVELLLTRGANKEHRNVSDYTPLSLAASGGYVNIIKLLLSHGAEINSRTGSKLGISPLMLAAMNGHTAAVKLLLDMGSDINAQIETNRNTALTLACFQGRHEVVSLLVDRKANIEHRAKTGLTPLMEAASGGYVEVGRVLLDKGADVNATPVPSSRDTALTIAADKGHYRFVELLIQRGAMIDVKNKKGNSPLWLACNGGHLDVVQLLVNAKADVDSQDNRKVSCLMAAFRKGHVKVVKWMVKHVTQFPSDPECMRFIQTVTDKELLKKCHQCMEIIVSAKDRQAAEANKNASILLEQIDAERSREETKRERAARKREKRRIKKKEKQQEKERIEKEEREKEELEEQEKRDREKRRQEEEGERCRAERAEIGGQKQYKDKVNREASADSSADLKDGQTSSASSVTSEPTSQSLDNKNKKKKGRKGPASKSEPTVVTATPLKEGKLHNNNNKAEEATPTAKVTVNKSRSVKQEASNRLASSVEERKVERNNNRNNKTSGVSERAAQNGKKSSNSTGIGDLDDFESLPGLKIPASKRKDLTQKTPIKGSKSQEIPSQSYTPSNKQKGLTSPSPKKGGRREDGWKEVNIRRPKKIMIPGTSVTRVIGRHGVHINAIRETSGANIDIDKAKGAADRTVTIKGPTEAMKKAFEMIQALIKDPDKDVDLIIPKIKTKVVATNTLTLSTNVWHNSIVDSKTTSRAQATSSTIKTTSLTSTNRPVVTSATKSNPQPPPLGAFQVTNGTAIWGNPGQPPVKVSVFSSTVTYTPEKNPSLVAKQLFTGNQSSCVTCGASIPSLAATYSSPAMAKTAVVNTNLASPAFSTKVDASKQQKVPLQIRASTPGAISRPQMNGEAYPQQGIPSTPQGKPQGIPPQVQGKPPQQMQDPSQASQPGSAPHYSPFNNLFSQAANGILVGKKEDLDNRKNFASVAAAGLSTAAYNLAISSAASITTVSELDPSKAPGYKAPGQRPMVDGEASKAPGYRVQYMGPPGDVFNNSQQQAFIGGGGNPPMDYGRTMFRGPLPPQFEAQMGYVKQGPSGPPSLSPHSASSTPAEQSPRGSRGSLRTEEEYSSPHTPMTLPKIESNLNPNAPNFMSRTGQLASFNTPPPPGATPPLPIGPNIHPAFRPSYPTPPPVTHHNNPFNSNPHSQGLPQGPFNPPRQPGLPLNDFQQLLVASSPGLLGGQGIGSGNMARTGSPLTVQARTTTLSDETPLRSMNDSPQQPSSQAQMSHSPVGPGGVQIPPQEEAGPPRPIGVERGHKRGSTPSYPDGYLQDLEQLGNQGLWSYSDMPNDWLVKSAMPPHPVMSTTNSTAGPLELGSRPRSQPAFQNVLPPGGQGYLDPGSVDQIDNPLNRAGGTRSLFTSADAPTSVSSVFVNGLHTPRPSQQHSGLTSSLGSGGMWGQSPSNAGKLDSADSTGSTDSKLGWSWPGTPPNA